MFFHKHEGASTIEQQLVRVLTNDYERTLKRKLKEIYLASHLRKYADKETIAIAYLDIAYYGGAGIPSKYQRNIQYYLFIKEIFDNFAFNSKNMIL